MNGSLDTSILVQLVTGQRPELTDAIDALLDEGKNKFAIADAALLELAFVLEKEKQLPRKNIVVVYQMLQEHHALLFNRKVIAATSSLYVKHPQLSFYDCYLSTHAENASATPLWTLDKKLANQSSNVKLLTV